MDTIHLPPDFKEFIQSINSAKVEYLVIGGYAVGFHGAPRFTADIDALPKLVRHEMQNVLSLRVPLKTDVKSGDNWANCEPWTA